LHTAAIGAAAVLLWAWSSTTDDADWLYRGGLTVAAVLVGVVITSVTAATPGPLGRLLSLGPVRWIGLISYGLYLWHWRHRRRVLGRLGYVRPSSGRRGVALGDPELDRFLTSELDRALSVLESTGARVVVLTAPYFEPPDLANRVDRYQSLFERHRVDHWNELLRSVAQGHPDSVTVVDLHAYLNPNGEFVNTIAGVDPIRSDGIHFSAQGADVVARWLSPRFVRIARQKQDIVATTNASVGSRPPRA
jgi:SGNH domain (fused to AT3 domains)